MRIKIVNILVLTLLICIMLLANNLAFSLSVPRISKTSDEDETEYWAVIVDICPGPIGNTGGAKTCLIQHGWKEDHIKMVFNITYNDFDSAISWLSEKADANDVVLLCSNTHGMDGYILLTDCNLYYTTINEWLDQLNVKGIFYSISACHSGSAIPILGKEGRVIMTACESNESGGTAWFLCFLYMNYDCVEGFGYDGAPSPNGAFYRRDNDLNGDGWVSAEEAFIYAKEWTEKFHNDFWINTSGDNPIHPQIYDGYCGELNICHCTQTPPNIPTCSYNWINNELKVSSMDLEGDDIRYGISWNNDGNVDNWTEFYDSGAEVSINCQDRKGVVGVIAEDELGAQSGWASVKAENLGLAHSILLRFTEIFPNAFPILQQIHFRYYNVN